MTVAMIITEDVLGSACSGTSGDLNRVLTLSNTLSTVDNGMIVFITGMQQIKDTDYTIVHLSAGTQITFLRNIFDDMPITVQYFESATITPTIITGYSRKIQMVMAIISREGQTATLTKVATTRDAMGGITAYTNTDYSIFWLQNAITEKDRNLIEMGLAVSGDMKAFFFPYYTSTVTGVAGPDITISVGDIVTDGAGNKWRIETKLGGRLSDGEEIFSPAIVRRINLD